MRREADSFQFDRPILVTGTPRSGKTVVSRLLGEAPEFTLLAEPGPIWDIGMGRRDDDVRTAEEASEIVRRRIRRVCHQAVERSGKSRYLDDLAYHALRIPFVARVLPEAKIVHVVRDPYRTIPEMTYWWGRTGDTVGAAIARKRAHLQLGSLPRLVMRFGRNWLHARLRGLPATWGPAVPGLVSFRESHSPAEVAAFQWQGMVEIARADLEALPASRWLEVRYEDLLADPAAAVARLAAFCEVEEPDKLVEFGRQYIDPNHPIYAEVEPTPEQWAAIDERIAPLCRQLGYAPTSRST